MKRHNLTIPQWFLGCPYLGMFQYSKNLAKVASLESSLHPSENPTWDPFKIIKRVTFQKMELINIHGLEELLKFPRFKVFLPALVLWAARSAMNKQLLALPLHGPAPWAGRCRNFIPHEPWLVWKNPSLPSAGQRIAKAKALLSTIILLCSVPDLHFSC